TNPWNLTEGRARCARRPPQEIIAMNRKSRIQLTVEALETRNLLSLTLSSTLLNQQPLVTAVQPVNYTPLTSVVSRPPSSSVDSSVGHLLDPKYQIPERSSLPGAAHTLYLNFGGDSRSTWTGYTGKSLQADGTWVNLPAKTYSNVQMEAFDTDG